MNILDEIAGAKTIAITGHVNPDGDCLGSTLGTYNYILANREDIGKEDIDLFLGHYEKVFEYMPNIAEAKDTIIEGKHYDVTIVLDCSDTKRIEPFISCYDNADKVIWIDHHKELEDYGTVRLVDEDISSASELLYSCLEDSKINKDVATCIYTGIIHDTGVFKYESVNSKTMNVAGKMLEYGIDKTAIIDNTFYAKTYIQNQILGRALLESFLFFDGKCIASVITKDIMDFYGVTGVEMGGVVEQLRLTSGVEVALFLYQKDDNLYKLSLRSKSIVDVAKIANSFGGGGHIRAAGADVSGKPHDIINSVSALIAEQMD